MNAHSYMDMKYICLGRCGVISPSQICTLVIYKIVIPVL